MDAGTRPSERETALDVPHIHVSFLGFFVFFFRFSNQQSFTGSLQEPPPHQHLQQQTSKQATKTSKLHL